MWRGPRKRAPVNEMRLSGVGHPGDDMKSVILNGGFVNIVQHPFSHCHLHDLDPRHETHDLRIVAVKRA